jgi:hypothetical protein
VADQAARERRAVAFALAGVVAAAAALASLDLVRAATADEPDRIEQVRRCFEEERGTFTSEVLPGSPAETAELGALRVFVETNLVTYAIAGSEEAGGELAARARAAGPVTVEQRGDTVLIWQSPPSPTQQQAVYNCSY